MAEEKKNVETEEIVSTENNAQEETKQKEESEWEKQLKEMLHNAYARGMSVGGRTFVGLIYETIVKERKLGKLNTAKILIKIEKMCKRMLDVNSAYIEKTKPEASAESTENNENPTPTESGDENEQG